MSDYRVADFTAASHMAGAMGFYEVLQSHGMIAVTRRRTVIYQDRDNKTPVFSREKLETSKNEG